MAPTKNVQAEIARFLGSDSPGVLCLSGKWGVGKTFLWAAELQNAHEASNFAMARYAYVSLFGLNSLDDLRFAIFENTVLKENVLVGPNVETYNKGIHLAEKIGRNGLFLARLFPFAKDFLTTSKGIFLAVRNQMVCIDDLERHGKDLDLKDVLGLASMLKEQRGCKIVLLLNEEQLPTDSRLEFDRQLEKVVDIKLRFDPTPKEAAQIGLKKDTAVEALLAEYCPLLGIKNIRVIKKIEEMSLRIADLLVEYDPLLLQKAVHSIALFGWIHLQPDLAPSLSFIMDHYTSVGILGLDDDQIDNEKFADWRRLLTAYEFMAADELALLVSDAFVQGYFDAEALKEQAEQIQKQIAHQKLDSKFSEVWDLYHDSFDDNAEALVAAMVPAFKSSVSAISPLNLNGTVILMKELGQPKVAQELLDFYIRERAADRRFFDLNEYPFGRDAIDPDMQAAFADQLAKMPADRDPVQILINVTLNSGWNEDDMEVATLLTTDEFLAAFKSLRGKDLRRFVQGALRFRNMKGLDPKYVAMSSRAEEALRRIAVGSVINQRRISQKYGIDLNVEEPVAPAA